jgi:arylsulfatase
MPRYHDLATTVTPERERLMSRDTTGRGGTSVTDRQPNILLITSDQQRYDTCGESAPSFMRTPHINQLAREGISFTRAYATCPLCVPSRISIMTGHNVFSHGMTHNGATGDVMGRERTLPSALRDCGYQTAAIGKMHFHPQRKRHGFDEMILPDDYFRQMQQSGAALQPMRHGLGQNEFYPSMSTVPEAQTLTSWIAEQSADYIGVRRDPDVPFFLWCSFSKPHPPFDPPEPYYSMYRDCDIPDPVVGDWRDGPQCPPVFRREQTVWGADTLSPETIRAARVAYYGLITQIDYSIGRLFAALTQTGLLQDTLILFASDHGEMLGDHRAVAKTYAYEAASHVPLVLRLPPSWDDRHHGESCDALVDLCDIMPTLLTAAGGRAPADVDGLDLVGTVRGIVPRRHHLEMMVAGRKVEQAWGNFVSRWGCFYTAITDGRTKYIWYPEGGREQLFDLEADPNELKNIADEPQHRQTRDALRREMIRRHAERKSDLVSDGALVEQPIIDVSDRDLRNYYRLACMNPIADSDVRH